MREVPELVLVAANESMASAWDKIAAAWSWVRVHRGDITEVAVDAVVSPANSFGHMRGGIDAVYARWLPGVEDRVRAAIETHHGGELPVGSALAVATGAEPPRPRWLISAPTMRLPGTRLAADGAEAGHAARAVLRLWREESLLEARPARDEIASIALPGLGTGVGGLSPDVCADRVAEALREFFG